MEKHTLKITDAPSIRFVGELIGRAYSSDNQAMGGVYSGSAGCWIELELYRTARGKYVCHRADMTCWEGNRDEYEGCKCETLEEVIRFFGHGDLAKELYEDAGIDDAIEIE